MVANPVETAIMDRPHCLYAQQAAPAKVLKRRQKALEESSKKRTAAMRKLLIAGLAWALGGCGPTPPSTTSPTPTGQVSELAGDKFELMGRESTITFTPDQAEIHIGSM